MQGISVITLNCWGVFTPLACEKRHERFDAIGAALSDGKHDIVCLQEIWTDTDFEKMKTALRKSYPHSVYFHSNLIGSGCCVFSKFRILETFSYAYSLNGYWQRVYHGDWFGGKGVGLARLETTSGFLINVYVTHLHARYVHLECDDDYSAHRIAQAFELGQFIRLTSANCDAVVMGGDLNMSVDSVEYRVLTSNTGFKDAWLDQKVPPEEPEIVGCTSDRPDNTFGSAKWQCFYPHGERLDYIMYLNNAGTDMTCSECKLTLGKVPGKEFNYSDHEGVEADFLIKRSPTAQSAELDRTQRKDAFLLGVQGLDVGLNRVVRDRAYYAVCLALLLVLMTSCWSLLGPSWFGALILALASVAFACIFWTIVVGKAAERRALLNTKQHMLFLVGQDIATKTGDSFTVGT